MTQCGGLCGIERIAVRRHVSATLQHLPNDLIFGHARCDAVEGGSAQSACPANGVAIAALLVLQHDCTCAFQWRAIMQVCVRNGVAAPRVHNRAPWSESSEVREYS